VKSLLKTNFKRQNEKMLSKVRRTYKYPEQWISILTMLPQHEVYPQAGNHEASGASPFVRKKKNDF